MEQEAEKPEKEKLQGSQVQDLSQGFMTWMVKVTRRRGSGFRTWRSACFNSAILAPLEKRLLQQCHISAGRLMVV